MKLKGIWEKVKQERKVNKYYKPKGKLNREFAKAARVIQENGGSFRDFANLRDDIIEVGSGAAIEFLCAKGLL